MEYKFETFDEKPFYRTGSEAHVSIYSEGSIYLNKRALELLGDPDAVALMYDRESSVIGIQATPPSRHHAFRLRRKANRSYGCTLRAKSFFRRFKIETEETLAFRKPEVNKNGILILNMNEVFSVAERK